MNARRQTLRTSLATFLGLAALALAPAARAQTAGAPATCDAGSACAHGFTCQVSGGTACPAIACLGDGACETCTPQFTYSCEPATCETDSDCATGMVCYTDSATSCPGVATPPKCPAEQPDCGVAPAVQDAGACVTTTSKTCVAQYQLPCTASSDCGPGFNCVADTATECSGGGSAGSAGSASGATSGGVANGTNASTAPAVAEDGGCTTTPTGTSSCQAQTITCTTDADCPATWTCTAAIVACANIDPAVVDGAAPVNDPCTTATPASTCTPPYAWLGAYGAVSNGESSAPTSASLSDGGTATTTTGAGSNAAAGSAASSAPHASSGGCDVSGATSDAMSGGATGLFWVLGLLGASRRRRRG
jgi:hypothetical protein